MQDLIENIAKLSQALAQPSDDARARISIEGYEDALLGVLKGLRSSLDVLILRVEDRKKVIAEAKAKALEGGNAA